MTSGRKVNRKQLERAARIYYTNKDAAEALGMAPIGFARRCEREGIESPAARSRRLKE